MWDGDFGGRKKFNLGKTQQDKKRQLAKVRKQREERRLQTKREDSANLIQKVTRAHLCRKEQKEHLRASWNPEASTPLQISQVIRQFLVFYDERLDSTRLQSICKLLIPSLKSTDIHRHYCSLLSSSETTHTWLYQTKRLGDILLNALSTSSGTLKSKLVPITTLWLLLDNTSWKFPRTPELAKQIKYFSFRLMSYLVSSKSGGGLLACLKFCALEHMFLFESIAADEKSHISSHKHMLIILFATSVKCILAAHNESDGKRFSNARNGGDTTMADVSTSSSSTSSPLCHRGAELKQNKNESDDVVMTPPHSSWSNQISSSSISSFSGKKRKSRIQQQHSTPNDVIFQQFVSQILSIPLLVSRIRQYELQFLIKSITGQCWDTLLRTIIEHNTSLDEDFITTPSSKSHSWFDKTYVKTVPPSPRKGFMMYDEGDSSDEEDKVELEYKSSSSGNVAVNNQMSNPPPISNYGWLLGNILQLEQLQLKGKESSKTHFTTFVTAITRLLVKAPSRAFPSKKTNEFLHPEYLKQLDILTEKDFLNRVSDELVRNSGDLDQIYVLCQIMDSLFVRCPELEPMILNKLVYSTDLTPRLWKSLQASDDFGVLHHAPYDAISVPFCLFCSCYSHLLKIQDDEEFHKKQFVFDIANVTHIVHYLRDVLYRLYWVDPVSAHDAQENNTRLKEVALHLFRQLRHRQSRKHFCHPDVWLMSDISGSVIQTEIMNGVGRSSALVREIPFVLPFDERVKLFYYFIKNDKERAAENPHIQFAAGHGIHVTIHRDRVLEDGYAKINGIGERLKGRIQIEFVDEHGLAERGIDGGGLFKEFLTTLSLTAYDPNYGLFKETPQRLLYPNPGADIHESYLGYMGFLGRILGKSMYDGILIEPKFANFFLHKILGTHNFIDDLQSLDEDIYNNLMFLKRYMGDISELALTFCTSDEKFGNKIEVELIPNGSQIPVTNENKLRYINRVADFKLNIQLQKHINAFRRGLYDIMKPEWIKMFSADELQQLISGSDIIDIKDWRASTHYSGGYNTGHEVVLWFWEIVDEMSESERAQLLKFCTSCSRAPLLGFKEIKPAFCFHRVSANTDDLPSASTCMNLFKVPRYNSKEKLKSKLLYAIQASEGFHMT